MEDNVPVRTYGQYCPVARASEVLGERWTAIILRNVLNGATTFTEIVADAPGIPRSLLTSRLRGLERAGVIETVPGPGGRGSRHHPTAAGQALSPVLAAMGEWAEQWLDLTEEHVDPGMLLQSWCRHSLAVENLPDRRVVVRFDFPEQPPLGRHLWLIVDGADSEVCRLVPGFAEDLVVTTDAFTLTEWHLGRLTWVAALRTGRIEVLGPPSLARRLPTWNRSVLAPD